MSATPSAPAPAPAKEEPKSFARRDHLLDIQRDIQARWDATKPFEASAPVDYAAGAAKQKYMCTFPYPYMNGKLHLGHAFSLTKAEFTAGYQRLRGKNVLFPFGFHCTGMPIQAAANKLKREIETGKTHSPAAAIPEAGFEAATPVETSAAGGAGASSTPVAAEASTPAAAEDSSAAAAASAGDVKDPSKFSGKKTKAVAKTGGPNLTQWEIMEKNGLAEAEIPAFQDPHHWLEYFPPLGKRDLQSFGCHVDWRRSFITTDANPFYDSFIRWQFNTLRKRDKLGFGKRPTIFSPIDGQACADHDRASGEGVNPQEYTLIKIQLKEVPAAHHAAAALAPLAALMAAGKRVYFVAATLRPETMYGQTNCFLLPEGDYGAFEVSDADVFICSERSARNMSYQNLSKVRGTPVCLGSWKGEDLLALPLAAPYATFPTVYTLPLLTISMKKGTGVVTSVPSDAPDDWAAFRDLKDKPKLREKYHIGDEMVAFDVVEIIDIPGFGRRAAVKLCDDLKIRSQNDAVLLKKAKETVYLEGFYKGVMTVGKYAGKKVFEAKSLVRADMIAEGLAAPYWEPENEVISRSGDECVVAELDQWYLKYGEEEWRGAIDAWVSSPAFKAYNPSTLGMFQATIAWLKEWACSRSFGLGTKLPWDPQFVIESLSDSTIYMAYYTVAHLLQGGNIDPRTGAAPGPLGIKPEQLTDDVWDYIFLGGEYPAAGAIAKDALDTMRREFEYWYPMDLRVSGKDLIGNHLTMALYNHAAVWGARPDRMPQSYFCNGHVLVDGEKMSKQRGNFITLADAIAQWGADCTRFALADAGDALEDANYERDKASGAILKLTTEEEFAKEAVADIAAGKYRTGEKNFADKVFEARIARSIAQAEAAYEAMRFRDALQYSFYQLQLDRDAYRDYCVKMETPFHAESVARFLEVQAIVLAPICPHWCEYMWQDVLGRKGTSVTAAAWPDATIGADDNLLAIDTYLQGRLHMFRVQIVKAIAGKPKKQAAAKAAGASTAPAKAASATVYIATSFAPWQKRVLEVLAPLYSAPTAASATAATAATSAMVGGGGAAAGGAGASASAPAPVSAPTGFPADVMDKVKAACLSDAALKPLVKKCMEFAAQVVTAHAGATAALPQLRGEVAFNEYDVWTQNIDYVRKALDVPVVNVLRVEDEGVVAGDSSNKAKDVVPLEPSVTAAAAASE